MIKNGYSLLSSHLSLHKPTVFWVLVLSLVTVLTYVNNHYFYKYKNLLDTRHYAVKVRIIDHFYQSCRSQMLSTCDEQLIQVLEGSRIRGVLTLSDADGREVIQVDNERFKDDRRAIAVSREIETDEGSYTLHVSRLSSPPIPKSVVRSMTFSAFDIGRIIVEGNYSRLSGFIQYVAIPRSRPAFFFTLSAIVVLMLARVQAKALALKIDQINDEVSRTSDLLHKIREDASSAMDRQEVLQNELAAKERAMKTAQDEINKLDEQLKQALESSETEEQRKNRSSRLESEIFRLKEKLTRNAEDYGYLKIEIEDKEKEIQKLKEREDLASQQFEQQAKEEESLDKQSYAGNDSFKKKLIKTLLSNPEIRSDADHKGLLTKQGRHHSKEFVSQVGRALATHQKLNGIIRDVISIEYNPRKLNRVELKLDQDRNLYCINIYSGDDQGYGAQIRLKINQSWQAVIAAKCIFHVVSIFRNYSLDMKSVSHAG